MHVANLLMQKKHLHKTTGTKRTKTESVLLFFL